MWHKIIAQLRWKKYEWLARSILKPVYLEESLKSEGYYSQSGQDKWIVETLLPELHSGVFLDIGAHDGVSFSNTLYLEQKLGWTGIAVEPIPEVFDKLNSNRQCVKVNGCIGSKSGKAKFQILSGYSEMLSGLVDEYDYRHLKRIRNEEAMYGKNRQEIEVDCYKLNEMLENHQFNHIDYLSMDVEGAEYSILSTFDFDRCNVVVIGVENNYKDNRIPQLLTKKGFEFHSVVGCDDFYIKRSIETRSVASLHK
jgi:FkbM family methyltransferase